MRSSEKDHVEILVACVAVIIQHHWVGDSRVDSSKKLLQPFREPFTDDTSIWLSVDQLPSRASFLIQFDPWKYKQRNKLIASDFLPFLLRSVFLPGLPLSLLTPSPHSGGRRTPPFYPYWKFLMMESDACQSVRSVYQKIIPLVVHRSRQLSAHLRIKWGVLPRSRNNTSQRRHKITDVYTERPTSITQRPHFLPQETANYSCPVLSDFP